MRPIVLLAVILTAGAALRADDVIRVGLIQMDGQIYDKEYNLARAEKGIQAAAARGATLLCTPEVAVQGYPRLPMPPGTSFDSPELVAGRAKILSAAETIPGPATERLARLSQELGVWIVFGIDENRHGRLFNTAVLMSPEGKITGTYSKVHLQNWMLASGVHHGGGFPVWDISIGGIRTKVGIEICYDIQHPESTLELALGGAEVVLIPYCTNDFARPLLVHLFQTRALENRIFLLRVNYSAPHNSGGSAIFDFEGSIQDALDQREGVLVGNLNLTALRKIRNAWNKVYGPENRYPEAYRRLRRESR
jgi:predicted amidohydrolase